MVYAIVRAGGRQEKVSVGDTIVINRVAGSAVDSVARAHLAQIEQKITDLRALRRDLDELIGQCSQGAISDCRIIEALGPEASH